MNSTQPEAIIKNFLNDALTLILPCSPEEALTSLIAKVTPPPKDSLRVLDVSSYIDLLDSVYNSNKKIRQRFSRETVYKSITETMFSKKFSGENFTDEDTSVLVRKFTDVLPEDIMVTAPISGIRLDNTEKLTIGPFEIGLSKNLELPISNDGSYYIRSEIKKSFDKAKSISIAQDEFDDFINIIFFIAGKKDNSIFIKTGLPSYPSYNHNQMYVETSSYQIQEKSLPLSNASVSNKIAEKLPVDNDFFINNKNFSAIWDLYKKRKNSQNISDFHSRILNCAISVGEALKNQNEKESIIHTCISLEILLSYDEGSLFQKSIADRLAEAFVFIVAKDKETRIKLISLLKKVYRMRSALVHGGNKEIDQSYINIIHLTRAALAEILTQEKYKEVKSIDTLYQMVKDAQNSY